MTVLPRGGSAASTVTGSGTTGTTAKFTGTNTIGNGWALDDGTTWGVAGAFAITEATGAVEFASTLTGGTSGSAKIIGNAAASSTVPTLIPSGTSPTTGIGANGANTMDFVVSGTRIAEINNTGLIAANAAGPSIPNSAATASVPTLVPNRASTTTGIGAQAAGNISLIVAGAEVMRFDSTISSTFKSIAAVSDRGLYWSNSTSDTTTRDTGIKRSAAGIVEVNNGTSGSLGGLWAGSIQVSTTTLDANAKLQAFGTYTDPAGARTGTAFGVNTSLTSNNANSVIGMSSYIAPASAFNYTHTEGAIGADTSVQSGNTGTITTATGLRSRVVNSSTGTITNASGGVFYLENNSASGVFGNAYGVRAYINTNAGTLTNTYGFYVGDVTTGTQTNQAYSFYASDTNARNFFAGTSTFGSDVVVTTTVRIGGASGPLWASGTGSPESVVTAPIGSFYSRTTGGAGTTWYVKESGAGNTGWIAK